MDNARCMTNDGLLTTAEVASRLGCTPRTVARRVERNQLKAHVKLAGKRGAYLFSPDAVDAAIRAEIEKGRAS